jgi:hypothetical protein
MYGSMTLSVLLADLLQLPGLFAKLVGNPVHGGGVVVDGCGDGGVVVDGCGGGGAEEADDIGGKSGAFRGRLGALVGVVERFEAGLWGDAPGCTPLRTLSWDGSGSGLGVGFGLGSPIGFGWGTR